MEANAIRTYRDPLDQWAARTVYGLSDGTHQIEFWTHRKGEMVVTQATLQDRAGRDRGYGKCWARERLATGATAGEVKTVVVAQHQRVLNQQMNEVLVDLLAFALERYAQNM